MMRRAISNKVPEAQRVLRCFLVVGPGRILALTRGRIESAIRNALSRPHCRNARAVRRASGWGIREP